MKKILSAIIISAALNAAAQDLQPNTTDALLKVMVVNSEKIPQEGEVVTFISQQDAKTYTGTTDSSGRFSVLIPKGQKYKVQYKVFSTDQDFKLLDIPEVKDLLTFEYSITVMPPKVYTLDNVFFNSGKTTLTGASYKELNELAEYMTRKKSMIIEIAGHTDNVGSAESNQKLSEDRANTVRNYLIKKGIAPERIIGKGYGDKEPIADNNTDAGKQKNRRTEVRIISQ